MGVLLSWFGTTDGGSAADFRVPFSKFHFCLADIVGLTSGSDSDTASRNFARRGPLAAKFVFVKGSHRPRPLTILRMQN